MVQPQSEMPPVALKRDDLNSLVNGYIKSLHPSEYIPNS